MLIDMKKIDDHVIDTLNQLLVTEQGITKDRIMQLGKYVKDLKDEVELNIHEAYTKHTYVRGFTVPSRVLVVGAESKEDCAIVVHRGTIHVWTKGGKYQKVVGPATFISKAGDQRVGYCTEECEWTNIFSIDNLKPHELDRIYVEATALMSPEK